MTIRFAPFASALAVLAASSSAGAYCRTITTPLPSNYTPSNDSCYEPAGGSTPLWWRNECVGFSVQQGGSTKRSISFSDADKTAQSAFAKWSAASCPTGGNPSIQAQDEGAVACSTVEYSEQGPNQHVIIFRDDAWPYPTDTVNTLALTTVTFDTQTGELFDADMEVNTADHDIVTTSPVPANAYDLESILTHEAGHFFGLAHTPITTAVMYAKYQPGSTSLEPDDISGICSAYLPNGNRTTNQLQQSGSFVASNVQADSCNATPVAGFGSACGPIGPAQQSGGGCTIAVGAGGTGAGGHDAGRWALVVLGLALMLAIRRRSANLSSMRRGRAFALCTLLAGGAGLAANVLAEREAQASVVITVLFDELVRDSTAAVIVTPVEQRSVWQDGRIYTYTRVHIDRPVAGTLEDDPWIRTMGGSVGRIGQMVEGEAVLTVGRPGLLFVQPANDEARGVYVVTARAQGQFPIVLDEKNTQRFVRASAVGGLVPTPRERVVQISRMRALAGVASGAPLATDVLHKRLIEDGVHDVAAAWARIHVSAH
jgi:hypothetical protein